MAAAGTDGPPSPHPSLELADWRRAVSGLYAAVRAQRDPEAGHALWRAGRDELMRTHPQSPLEEDDPLRDTGIPYWPYDPALRVEAPLLAPAGERTAQLPTGEDGTTTLCLIGRVELAAGTVGGSVGASLDVWWLQQYAGGIFLPVRDATAGAQSYGGGRYLLDTAKGADLGGTDATLVLDFNFLYHPSCRYNPRWSCPLAPRGDWIDAPLRGGERME